MENKENHLENGLVDLGAATKLKLQKTNVKSEWRRKFQGECKQFVIDFLLKISERSLMQFSIVQNMQLLDPVLMARFPEVSSQRFTKLADRLFALNKISANTAEKKLLNMAHFELEGKFLNFKMKSGGVDVFLMYLLTEKSHADPSVVIKIVCIIYPGQSFKERGFSINNKVNDCNRLDESLICQRVVSDALQECDKEIYEIEIDLELWKSCLLITVIHSHEYRKLSLLLQEAVPDACSLGNLLQNKSQASMF